MLQFVLQNLLLEFDPLFANQLEFASTRNSIYLAKYQDLSGLNQYRSLCGHRVIGAGPSNHSIYPCHVPGKQAFQQKIKAYTA